MLTIVMYHYVRDVARSRFARLKALDLCAFEQQLDYLCRHFVPCGSADVMGAIRGEAELPPNACLLTFDDGLADHCTQVLPRLQRRGLTAVFAPCGLPLQRGLMLDVHKIHLILASGLDDRALLRSVFEAIDACRAQHEIPSNQELYGRFAVPGRFDGPEISFVKRVLQRGLSPDLRTALVDDLFRKHVTEDEAGLSAEFYLTLEQLRELDHAGMEIANHGRSHQWLDTLSPVDQALEIDAGLEMLSVVRRNGLRDWVMSFPFGGYDHHTLEIVANRGCGYGLSTRVGVVQDLDRPLELPRLDTNDLPPRGSHPGLPKATAAHLVGA